MSKRQKIQYTIREVPEKVDKLLRKKAREEELSVNRAAIKVLEEGLLGAVGSSYEDLDFCIGSWEEEDVVREALKEQRKIDNDLWK